MVMYFKQYQQRGMSGAVHLVDVNSNRAIDRYFDIWFYITITDTEEFTLWKFDSLTQTETSFKVMLPAPAGDWVPENGVVRVLDNALYLQMTWMELATSTADLLFQTYQLNPETAAVIASGTQAIDSGWADSPTEPKFHYSGDIAEVNGTITFFRLHSHRIFITPDFFYVKSTDYSINGGTGSETIKAAADDFWILGNIDKTADLYKWIQYDATANELLLFTWPGFPTLISTSSGTALDIIPAEVPSDNETNFYWFQGQMHYLVYNKQFFISEDGGVSWGKIATSNDNDNCPIWGLNADMERVLVGMCFNNKVWEINTHGTIELLMDFDNRDHKKDIYDQSDIPGIVQWDTKRYPSLSGFNQTLQGAGATLTVSKEIDGAKNILTLTRTAAGGNGRVYYGFTPIAAPTFEFAISTSDVSRNNNWYFHNTNSLAGANIACNIAITGSGIICQHGDGAGGVTSFVMDASPTNNIKYLISLTLDCATDTLSCSLDGISKVVDEEFYNDNTFATIETLSLFSSSSAAYSQYFDAFGIVGVDGYITDSNNLLKTDFITGMNGWFLADGEIYQVFYPSINVDITATATRKLYIAPSAILKSSYRPFIEQYIKLVDEDIQPAFEGLILGYKDRNEADYLWNIQSGISIDLERKVTASYDTQTRQTIIADVLANNADFLWIGPGDNGKVNQFTQEQIGGCADDWGNTDGTNCETIYLKEKTFLNGKMVHILQQFDNSGTLICEVTWSGHSNLIFSYKVASEDVTDVTQVEFFEGATRIGRLRIDSDQIIWYDGANHNLQAAVDFTIYHIAFVFNPTDDEVDIYIDGEYDSTQSLENNITDNITILKFMTGTGDSGEKDYYSDFYVGDSIVEALNTYSSVSPLPTETFSPQFRQLSIRDILKWMDSGKSYISTFGNNNQLYWDQFRPKARYIAEKNWIEFGDLSDWTFSNANPNIQHTVKSEVAGLNDVLELDDQDAAAKCHMILPITVQTTDFIYNFKIRSTNTNHRLHFTMQDSGTDVIDLEMDATRFQYNTTNNISVALNNIWYYCKITNVNFIAFTYDFYVNGVLEGTGLPFRNNRSSVNQIELETLEGDSGFQGYFQNIGFSFSSPPYIPASKAFLTVSDQNEGQIITTGDGIDTQSLKFSRAVLYGGYKEGAPVVAIRIGTPGFGTWTDIYANITDQIELEDQADEVIGARNITLRTIEPLFRNVGMFQLGEYIHIVSTTLGLDGTEDWLVMDIIQNMFTTEVDLILSDSFWQGSQGKNEVSTAVRNNEQNHGALEDRVTWVVRDIPEGTPDWDDTDMAAAGDDILYHDFDISAITDNDGNVIGQRKVMVELHIDVTDNASGSEVFCKPKGFTNEGGGDVVKSIMAGQGIHGRITTCTDENGVISLRSDPIPSDWTIIDIYVYKFRGY